VQDVLALRRRVAGLDDWSCEACADPPETRPAWPWLPGDVGPIGAPDGRVDIVDVVLLLRVAAGLDTPSERTALMGDIAPTTIHGGVSTALGNGTIDVADLVLALRAAVGLTRLEWPLRMLRGHVQSTVSSIGAVQVRTTGFPPWAGAVGVGGAGCEGQGNGVDTTSGLLVATCANDVGEIGLGASMVEVTYKAPREVEATTLAWDATVFDSQAGGLVAAMFVAEGSP
jgi:hypothetical protein